LVLWLFLFADLTPPTAADVQAVEEARILEPLTDYSRDGRAYVERAPSIETRADSCAPIAANTFECTYETRLKDFLDPEFGPWEPRRERVEWRDGCWKRVALKR
jgi:hypothetical protein